MHRRSCALTMLAVFCVSCLVSGSIRASEIQPISYQLAISTDLNVLRDPHDPVNQLAATWKTPSQIAVARETPLFRLTNTSASAGITNLALHMNEAAYVFDAVVVAEAPHGMAPDLDSPLDWVQEASTSSKLSFSFADRELGPNESFAFWVDIDPIDLPATHMIDYRNVLWDPMGDRREDNMLVQVTFDSGQLPPAPLFNYSLANQSYDSTARDAVTGQSFVFPLAQSADFVGAFFFEQAAPTETQPLPEPASLLLMAVGLLTLAANWRRRYRF